MNSFAIKSAIKKTFHVFLAVWYGMLSTEAVWYEPYRDSCVETPTAPLYTAPLAESIKTFPEPRLRFDLDITDPLSKVWVSFTKPGEAPQPYPLYVVPAVPEKTIGPNLEDQGRRFMGQYGGATFDFRVTFPSKDQDGDPFGSVDLYQLTSQYAVDFVTNGLLITHTLESMSDIRLSADRCITKGKISAQGNLTLRTRTSLFNLKGSSLSSPKRVLLRSQEGNVENQEALVEGNEVKIKAHRFVNKQGRILSKNAHFNLDQELINSNRSLIVSSDHLSIITPLFQNINSSFVSSKSDVFVENAYFSKGAIFSSTQTKNFQASILDLKDRSRLFSGIQSNFLVNKFLNQGSFVESGGTLNVWVHQILRLTDGEMAADEKLNIRHVSDSFVYSHYDPLQQLHPQSDTQTFKFENIRSHIRSGGELRIQAPNGYIINQEGSFEGTFSHIETKRFLNDRGTIKAQKNILRASYFENKRGMLSGENIVLKIKLPFGEEVPGSSWKEHFRNSVLGNNSHRGHLFNTGGTIQATSSLIIDAESVLLNNDGLIQGGRELQLTALVLGNINGGQIGGLSDNSDTNLIIKVTGDLYNQGSNTSISSSSKLTLHSSQGKILNHKGALIQSPENFIYAYEEFSNDASHLKALRSLSISTPQGRFSNQQGLVTAGEFIFNGQGFYNFDKGTIETTDILIKVAGTAYNRQASYIRAQKGITIEALYLDNSEGSLLGETISLNLGNGIPNDFYLKSLLSPHNPFSAKERIRQQTASYESPKTSTASPPSSSQEKPEATKKEGDQPAKEADSENGPSLAQDHLPVTIREAGCLINVGGSIEAQDSMRAVGTGDFYNSDGASLICHKGPLDVHVFGRLINQDDSRIFSKQGLVITTDAGILYNGAKSSLQSLEKLTLRSAQILNETGGDIDSFEDIILLSNNLFVNAGHIKTERGNISLTSLIQIQNVKDGLIDSGGTLTMTAPDGITNSLSHIEAKGDIFTEGGSFLNNKGSKLVSLDGKLTISKTKNIYNASGEIEAKGDIDLVSVSGLYNAEGAISSENNITITGLENHCSENAFNDQGLVKAKKQLSLGETTISPYDIAGTLEANTLRLHSSLVFAEIADFHLLLQKVRLDINRLLLYLPNFFVRNIQDTTLNYHLDLTAKKFFNKSGRFWSHKSLSIHTTERLINGSAHLEGGVPTSYKFTNDWDIRNNTETKALLSGEEFYYKTQICPIASVIGSDQDLSLESESVLLNTGGIEGRGHVTLTSPQITTGWVHEIDDITLLQEGHTSATFGWKNWFYEPQPNYILAHNLLTINGRNGLFLNMMGTVEAHQGIDIHNCKGFLNFAGQINVLKQPAEAKIRATYFINTLGLIATNIADKRYWSIDYANTNPAFFSIHEGFFEIETEWMRNSASFLYGRDGVFINGKPSEEFTQAVNINRQLSCTRMYTIGGTTSHTETSRFLFWREKTTTHTHWIANLNETLIRDTLPASISSRGPVEAKNFDAIAQQGTVHASSVLLESRDSLAHGYQENIALRAMRPLPLFIDGGEMVREFPVGGLYQRETDINSPYFITQLMSPQAQRTHLSLTILENPELSWPTTGLFDLGPPDFSWKGKSLKMAASPEILSMLLIRCIQQAYNTAYFPSFVSLGMESQRAYDNALTQNHKPVNPKAVFGKMASKSLNFLARNPDNTLKPVLVLSRGQAITGLYFQPQLIDDTLTLVPIYYPEMKDIRPSLGRMDGATIAQENPELISPDNGTVAMKTKGKVSIKGKTDAAKHVVIEAGEGGSAESRTRTQTVQTHGVKYSSEGRLFRTETKSDWVEHHEVTRLELLTSIETGIGGNVIIKIGPDASFAFKGVEVLSGGNLSLCGHRFIIEALEEQEVVSCMPGSAGGMFSTIKPHYVRTLLLTKNKTDVDADFYENLGSALISGGDITLKVRNRIIQRILGKPYVASHRIDAKQKMFSSTVTSQAIEENVTSVPETQSLNSSVHWNAPSISFEGILGALGGSIYLTGVDIEGKSRTFVNKATVNSDQDTLFRSTAVSSHMERSYLSPTVVLASQDFIVEATNRYFEEGIYAQIGGNVRQRAHIIETRGTPMWETTHTTMKSSGFGSLGTEAIVHMANGDFGKVGQAFLNNIPLLQQLKSWDQAATSADEMVTGTKSLITLYNNAHQIAQGASQGGWAGAGKSLLNVLNIGEISFSTTRIKSRSETKSAAPTSYDVKGEIDRETASALIMEGPVMQSGGCQFYTGQTIQVTPILTQTDTFETMETQNFGCNPLLMTASAGVSGSASEMKSKTHIPGIFNAKEGKVFFVGTQNVSLTNPSIESPLETLIKAPTIYLEALPDTIDQRSHHYNVGITVGLTPAAAGKMAVDTFLNLGVGNFRNHAEEVPTNSTIKGPVRLEADNPIRNIGVLIQDPNGAIISAPSYVFQAIQGSRTRDGFGGSMSFNVSSVDALQQSLTKNIACGVAALAAGEACHAFDLGDTAASLTAMLASAATSNYLNERWHAEESKAGEAEKPASKATNTGFGNFFGESGASGINVGGEVSYSHGTRTTTAPLIDVDMKNLQKSWKTLRQVAHLDIGESLTVIADEATTPEMRQAAETALKVDEALEAEGISKKDREKAFQDEKLAAALQISIAVKDAAQGVLKNRPIRQKKQSNKNSDSSKSKGEVDRPEQGQSGGHADNSGVLPLDSLTLEEKYLVAQAVTQRLKNFSFSFENPLTSQYGTTSHPDLGDSQDSPSPHTLRTINTFLEEVKQNYPTCAFLLDEGSKWIGEATRAITYIRATFKGASLGSAAGFALALADGNIIESPVYGFFGGLAGGYAGYKSAQVFETVVGGTVQGIIQGSVHLYANHGSLEEYLDREQSAYAFLGLISPVLAFTELRKVAKGFTLPIPLGLKGSRVLPINTNAISNKIFAFVRNEHGAGKGLGQVVPSAQQSRVILDRGVPSPVNLNYNVLGYSNPQRTPYSVEYYRNFTRELGPQDFGLTWETLQELKGAVRHQNGTVTVRVDMVRAFEHHMGNTNHNPIKVIENLVTMAQTTGANTLKIEGTLANKSLLNILRKKFNAVTHGANETVTISLK